jgi:hypothetical protein
MRALGLAMEMVKALVILELCTKCLSSRCLLHRLLEELRKKCFLQVCLLH